MSSRKSRLRKHSCRSSHGKPRKLKSKGRPGPLKHRAVKAVLPRPWSFRIHHLSLMEDNREPQSISNILEIIIMRKVRKYRQGSRIRSESQKIPCTLWLLHNGTVPWNWDQVQMGTLWPGHSSVKRQCHRHACRLSRQGFLLLLCRQYLGFGLPTIAGCFKLPRLMQKGSLAASWLVSLHWDGLDSVLTALLHDLAVWK